MQTFWYPLCKKSGRKTSFFGFFNFFWKKSEGNSAFSDFSGKNPREIRPFWLFPWKNPKKSSHFCSIFRKMWQKFGFFDIFFGKNATKSRLFKRNSVQFRRIIRRNSTYFRSILRNRLFLIKNDRKTMYVQLEWWNIGRKQ